MEKLYSRLSPGKENRTQRNEILETLLRKIADLEQENMSLRRDLSRTIEMRDECMADADRGAAAITILQTEIMTLLGRMTLDSPRQPTQEHDIFLGSTPFVVVLIDGSRTMLSDEHVRQGNEGGRLAVARLHDHLMQYLIKRKIFQTHWRLIVKFYASMSNLGTFYIKSGVIEEIGVWREFINGFNEEYPLSYFVDAGVDQKQAEHKIQDQLESFFGHRNCQHTVLVGSEDGSYTGFLRQYMRSDELCGRITVVEAIPFPGEFKELSSRFLPPQKDSLFPSKLTNCCTPAGSPARQEYTPIKKLTSQRESAKTIPCSTASRLQPPAATTTPATQSPTVLPSSELLSTPSKPRTLRMTSLPQYLMSTPTPQKKISSTIVPHRDPPSTRNPTPVSANRLIRRKPLADIQTRLPRPRNTFFNSQGQRVDSKAYVSMYTQRYLEG